MNTSSTIWALLYARSKIYPMGRMETQGWPGKIIKVPVLSASVTCAGETKADSVEAATIYVHDPKTREW